MTLKELKAAIKPLGYKIKTKKLSWGRHLTYVHVESGSQCVMSVYTPEQLKMWAPLHEYLRTIPMNVLLVDDDGQKVYGSDFGGRVVQCATTP